MSEATAAGRDFLFVSPRTGERMKSMTTAWENACKAAGIHNLRVHDLRHTFGTRAADGGAPLPAIRDVMGHKSVKTTERYTHATDEAKRRAVEIAGQQATSSGSEKRHKKDTKGGGRVVVLMGEICNSLIINAEGGTRTRTAFWARGF